MGRQNIPESSDCSVYSLGYWYHPRLLIKRTGLSEVIFSRNFLKTGRDEVGIAVPVGLCGRILSAFRTTEKNALVAGQLANARPQLLSTLRQLR